MSRGALIVRGTVRFAFWTVAGAVLPGSLWLAGWLVSHT